MTTNISIAKPCLEQKIVAFGDLHGHYDQFMEIINKFMDNDWYGVDPNKDVFVFLGDYVDGGPESQGILLELMSLKEQFPHWKFLFGNHESLLLDALNPNHPVYGDYYLWWNQGGRATLESFKRNQAKNDLFVSPEISDYDKAIMQPKELITKEYLDFIKNLEPYYETDDYFFCHAGIMPGLPLQDTIGALEGITPETMTDGDPLYDLIWMREPFLSSEFDWGKRIIFGHTAHINPLVMSNKIGLDTMFHNQGKLTAVILPEERFIFSEEVEE